MSWWRWTERVFRLFTSIQLIDKLKDTKMLIFIFLNQCDTVFSFPIAIEEDDKTEYYVLGALAVVGTLVFMIGLCSFTVSKLLNLLLIYELLPF